MARFGRWAVLVGVGALVGVNYAPEALAFPHRTGIGDTVVYSLAPTGDELAAIMARSDARVAASPLAAGGVGARRVFLTDGGWRWQLLSIGNGSAFALTRPFSNAIVLNASDPAADVVRTGRAVGGTRTLSGVIAHETVHLLLARRYGTLRARSFPSWKVEGYADFVAQESSLSEAEASRLRAAGSDHPALAYFDGRQRVERLIAGGMSADALFSGSD